MSFKIWRMIACVLLAGNFVSCASFGDRESAWKPLKTFTEADVIGVWEQVNPAYNSELLTINADHSFTQIYEAPQRSFHAEVHGSWRIVPRASGCTYVHLDGMRNFHLTDSAANNGNRDADGSLMSFWEPCENKLITMPDKITLIVGSMRDYPRMIGLFFPRTSAESTDIMMRLTITKPQITAP